MLRRVLAESREDNLGDWAATLTSYAVLSIFPALLVLMPLLGLVRSSFTEPLIRNIGDLTPDPAQELVTRVLVGLQRQHAAAGVAGTLTLLWAASKYIAPFVRSMNAVYDMPEGRPAKFLIPLRLGLTLLTLVLVTAASALVVFGDGPAGHVGDALGEGTGVLTVWKWCKWPLSLILVSLTFALLYWPAPNARQPFRWGTPGGLAAVVLWITASAIFAIYASRFGSHNRVYGSLAAAIIFLIWIWLSNLTLLLGAELNAELERQRAIEHGVPSGQERYMVLRSAVKLHDDELQHRHLPAEDPPARDQWYSWPHGVN